LESFDVAIVGAGPTGLACGIELQKRGLKPVLFDKGCVVNSIYHYPINLVFFTTPELLEIGDIPMTSLNEKPGRTEALKYYRRVADHYRLNVHQYERVLGFDVPGEDLDKVIHYYREAHPYYNQDVLIVGAKNSAAISALELFWTGARVTMVVRGAGISHNVKYWIKPNIENRIKAGEIQAYFHSRVKEIRSQDVLLATPEGEVAVKNDFLFAMTGYRPDFEFMAEHGIHLDTATSKPITDPATLESERRGVYLAGVIVAGMHTNEIFIENGRFHGKLIAEAIAKPGRHSHQSS
jgi:thioredoxin reductase (NADPH)